MKIAFWASVTEVTRSFMYKCVLYHCCYCLCNVFLGCYVVSGLKFVKLCFLTCIVEGS